MPPPVRYQKRRRSPPSPAVCRTCKDTFRSSNALFQHLNESLHFLRSRKSRRSIVASKASRHKVGTGTAYKDFNYCEVRYQLSPKSPKSESWGCADTGSGMSLVDESVLKAGAPSGKRTVKSPVHIKGIGDEMYLSKESVVLDVFFPDVTNTRLAKITREFHIVQDMDCGLLVGNDIIEPEGIVINLAKKKMEISACDNMACQLKVRRRKERNHVVVRCAKQTVLKPGENIVPVRFPKLEEDYWFQAYYYCLPPCCAFYTLGRLGGDQKEIQIDNYSDEQIVIPKDKRLGYIRLPVLPQYTPVKPVDVVQCHFRKVAEPESPRSSTVTNEVTTVSINRATSPRHVIKKTSSTLQNAPAAPPTSVRCLPFLCMSVPPSSPVHSSRFPLRRSSFFFFHRRPLFSHPLLWQSPLGIPCDCQNVIFFPPKPGWQHRTKALSLCLC